MSQTEEPSSVLSSSPAEVAPGSTADETANDRRGARSRDRSLRRERSREREHRRRHSSRSRDRLRDRDRPRDRSRERERSRDRSYRRHGHRRSRSRSRSPRRRRDRDRDRRRSYSRSRSRSPPRPRRKAKPQAPPNKVWDGFQWVDKAVVVAPMPIVDPGAGAQAGGSVSMGSQKERRIYIGNLPAGITEELIKDFLNTTMVACGGVPAGMSSSVLSVWLGPDNKYAFVEMCTVDCATIALGLNGIQFMGCSMRFARPKTYTESGVPGGGLGIPAAPAVVL